MITVQIKSKIGFPNINVTLRKELKASARVIVGDMVNRIDQGVGIDGRSLPSLESKTVRQRSKSTRTKKDSSKLLKRRTSNLNPFQPLVQTGQLRSSFRIKKKGTSVFVFLRDPRTGSSIGNRELGDILSNKGVGRKKKTFNFFGVSERSEKLIIKNMNEIISKITRKFNSGG